jgi:hypothetical protein
VVPYVLLVFVLRMVLIAFEKIVVILFKLCCYAQSTMMGYYCMLDVDEVRHSKVLVML